MDSQEDRHDEMIMVLKFKLYSIYSIDVYVIQYRKGKQKHIGTYIENV